MVMHITPAVSAAAAQHAAGRSGLVCYAAHSTSAAASVTAERSQQKQHHVPPERQPRAENAPGAFYVDHTCIDCDTCRWMAPDTFDRQNEMSRVHAQPQTREQRHSAMQALLTCPTFSIHAADRTPEDNREAMAGMPIAIEGTHDVFHCGFSSEESFGSTAYLIVRPDGNVMVDVPRWSPQLAERIRAMGGIKHMLLTHRDDVAHHDRWAKHFDCQRVIHETEANSSQGTTAAEVKLTGVGPWQLPGGSDDVDIIHVPGHTRGSIALLYKPEKVLCSGDHFNYSWRAGRLNASPTYNWYSYDKQVESVAKLLDYDWLHLLPGHGRRAHMKDATDRLRQVTEFLEAVGYGK